MATSADRVNKKMGREGEGRGGEERAGKGQEGKEGRKKEEREGGGRKTNFTWSFYQHRISYKKKISIWTKALMTLRTIHKSEV